MSLGRIGSLTTWGLPNRIASPRFCALAVSPAGLLEISWISGAVFVNTPEVTGGYLDTGELSFADKFVHGLDADTPCGSHRPWSEKRGNGYA